MSQAATARANGAKSNGPITAEGKARSAQNSLKHGLTSSRVVLPHESQEAYDKLEASLINRFKPADDLESELVQEMAAARWRLRRIEAMEAALFKRPSNNTRKPAHPTPSTSPMPRSPNRSPTACSSATQPNSAEPMRRPGKRLQLIQADRNIDEEGELQNEPSAAFFKRQLDAVMMPLPGERSALPIDNPQLRS